MTDSENQSKGFVIRDKRRFDSSGNEISGNEISGNETVGGSKVEAVETEGGGKTQQESADGANRQSKPQAQAATQSTAQSDEIPELNFSSFVMSLATQALMQLGEIKPPPGIELEINTGAARQSIDILGMLQQKTKGNLDKDEEHLLEQILHNLRLSYVKAVS